MRGKGLLQTLEVSGEIELCCCQVTDMVSSASSVSVGGVPNHYCPHALRGLQPGQPCWPRMELWSDLQGAISGEVYFNLFTCVRRWMQSWLESHGAWTSLSQTQPRGHFPQVMTWLPTNFAVIETQSSGHNAERNNCQRTYEEIWSWLRSLFQIASESFWLLQKSKSYKPRVCLRLLAGTPNECTYSLELLCLGKVIIAWPKWALLKTRMP